MCLRHKCAYSALNASYNRDSCKSTCFYSNLPHSACLAQLESAREMAIAPFGLCHYFPGESEVRLSFFCLGSFFLLFTLFFASSRVIMQEMVFRLASLYSPQGSPKPFQQHEEGFRLSLWQNLRASSARVQLLPRTPAMEYKRRPRQQRPSRHERPSHNRPQLQQTRIAASEREKARLGRRVKR